jgi:uncharacterized membrane protein
VARVKLKFTYPILTLITYVFGLGVATFLWYSTLSVKVVGCLTGGCSAVLTSSFAKIFGVPISAYGFAFYAVGIIIILFRIIDDRPVIRLTSWAMSVVGVLSSVYFFYLELFKIHAICFWCKFSTAATIILLTLMILEVKKRGGISAIYDDIKSLYKKEV